MNAGGALRRAPRAFAGDVRDSPLAQRSRDEAGGVLVVAARDGVVLHGVAGVADRGVGQETRERVCASGDAVVVARDAVAGGRGLWRLARAAGMVGRAVAEASREPAVAGRAPVTARRILVAAGRGLGEGSRAVEGVVHVPAPAVRGLDVTARELALTVRAMALTVREMALTVGDAVLHGNQIGGSALQLGASRGKSPVGW